MPKEGKNLVLLSPIPSGQVFWTGDRHAPLLGLMHLREGGFADRTSGW
jgi:hypothetical protein